MILARKRRITRVFHRAMKRATCPHLRIPHQNLSVQLLLHLRHAHIQKSFSLWVQCTFNVSFQPPQHERAKNTMQLLDHPSFRFLITEMNSRGKKENGTFVNCIVHTNTFQGTSNAGTHLVSKLNHSSNLSDDEKMSGNK